MKINIHALAKLSNVTPPKQLEEKLEEQLEKTLTHVQNLEKINTSHLTGTNQVTNLSNVLREDKTLPSLTQEEALANAKKTYKGFFIVDAVLPGE